MSLYLKIVCTVCAFLISAASFAAQAPVSTAQPPAAQEIEDYVTFETNLGPVVIKLYAKKSPKTVRNFLKYVDSGFYDGTIIHRVVPGFVVQGGGYDSKFERKATSMPIRNESENKVKNLRGTLSMARTNNPHSATTQFFINLNDNPDLDWRAGREGYAVFGEVVKGMDIVDKIEALPRGKYRGPLAEAPNETVVIERGYRSQAPQSASAKK